MTKKPDSALKISQTIVTRSDLQIMFVNADSTNIEANSLESGRFYTEYLDFFLILDGEIEFKAFNKRRTLKGGELFVATQSSFIELKGNDKPFSYIRLRFLKNNSNCFSNIQRFSASLVGCDLLKSKILNHALFFASLIGEDCTSLSEQEQKIVQMENKLILTTIQDLILSGHKSLMILSKPIAERDLVVRSVELLEESTEEDLSVQNLADNFEVSHSYLVRCFKKRLGVVPNIYFRAIKLNKSLSLMSQKIDSLSEISYILGFSDQSHFTNCFKRFFMITPNRIGQH